MATLEQKVKIDYARYSQNGHIQTWQVKECINNHGGSIDDKGAMHLLLKIAGPERRMNEQKFIIGILDFIIYGWNTPSQTFPLQTFPPVPPYAFPPQAFPPEKQPPLVANINANIPHPEVAARLAKFYESEDDRIGVNEVITACRLYNIPMDTTTASKLLEIVSAPDGKMSKEKFVHHIGTYCTKYLR